MQKSFFDKNFSKHLEKGTRACTQDERKRYFQEICGKYRNSLRKNPSQFFVNSDRKVAFCSIPKNSCSTWKKLLAISSDVGKNMTHQFSSHSDSELQKRNISTMIYEHQFEKPRETIKFLVFRHPLSRFLSAHYETL